MGKNAPDLEETVRKIKGLAAQASIYTTYVDSDGSSMDGLLEAAEVYMANLSSAAAELETTYRRILAEEQK